MAACSAQVSLQLYINRLQSIALTLRAWSNLNLPLGCLCETKYIYKDGQSYVYIYVVFSIISSMKPTKPLNN
jgi:hypothetical protein